MVWSGSTFFLCSIVRRTVDRPTGAAPQFRPGDVPGRVQLETVNFLLGGELVLFSTEQALGLRDFHPFSWGAC